MKARILAALACVVVVLPAHAANVMTASQIYRSCRAPKESSSYTYCRAYIAGFFDGFRVGADAGSPNEFCPGPGLTAEKIWRKIERSLKPHRGQHIDELGVTILPEALMAAYRCKNGNSNSTKRADTRSTFEIYAACQSPKNSSPHTFCRGYLEGHLDGFDTGLEGMRPMRFCPEARLTAEKIWVKAEPSLKPGEGRVRNEAAEAVLSEALLSAYPCEKPK
jgi:hypothetical protein